MPISVSITKFWGISYFWSLWIKHHQPSLATSGGLYISASGISSSSYVQVFSRTCHKSIQTSNSHNNLLHASPWLPSILNMLEKILLTVPWQKISSWFLVAFLVLKGLPSLHLMLWLVSDVCCLDKGSVPQPSGGVWSDMSIYSKGSSAVFERMGKLVCLKRVYQNVISAPKFAVYLFI